MTADAITRAEAARILGVHVATVDRLFRGVLTPGSPVRHLASFHKW